MTEVAAGGPGMAASSPGGKVDTTVPHSAWIWDYWLGGKGNYPRKHTAVTRKRGAVPCHLRGPEEIAGYFEGLELLEPGVDPVSQWQPDPSPFGPPAPVDTFGGLARNRSGQGSIRHAIAGWGHSGISGLCRRAA